MNASLQRDVFANAGRTDYSTLDLIGASLNMERPKLPAPHQIVAELDKLVFETPPTSKRSLVFHAGITLEETLIGFLIGAALGVGLAVRSSRSRVLERSADALDRRLADGADHRARADDRRDPQPVRHRRHDAEGGDRGLSLLLSDHRRHGQRLPLAGPAAARSDANLFGDVGADSCEAARARQPAVLFRQHEDRRGGGAGRRGRCRGYQERGRRLGRTSARGLLLRADRADLGDTVCGRGPVGRPGRNHRPRSGS